jgi:D-alanyl-lipoteichoic acid acyltransferase DltB (MBOAT superfamily)
MSFSSLIFVLAFLPAAVLGYYLLALSPLHRLRLPFLIVMGLFFYGRAQPSYLPLLIASIAANYLLAVVIARNVTPDGSRDRIKGAWLTFGVTANTVMLLGFKYLSAVVAALFGFLGHPSPIGRIIAPLAISFYTFQQISFLIDTARGKVVPQGLIRYLSFIAFFPTLLAGPITLYSEMGPQLAVRPQRDRVPQNLLVGALLFTLGLFKKTVLADTIALWVDPIFTAVHHGSHPGFFLGWSAAIAYTLQIYFDFSGYCDMALGAARMLGIVLPLNFFSPLRSTSIADLWRRWHMTLGRFVRTYIHQPMMIPLARLAADKGLSKWPAMTVSLFVPTFLSMLIIGTWHGPSWTYVVFGTMHGTFMCINELYNALTRKRRKKKKDSQAALFTYGLLTVLAFVCAEVPFRADTVPDARHIFAAMIGLQGLGITHDWHAFLAPTGNGLLLPFMILGSLIVFLLPNTEQILDRIHPALEWEKWRTVDRPRISLTFGFTPAWIAVFSLILFLGFAFISRGTTSFIYFQF